MGLIWHVHVAHYQSCLPHRPRLVPSADRRERQVVMVQVPGVDRKVPGVDRSTPHSVSVNQGLQPADRAGWYGWVQSGC